MKFSPAATYLIPLLLVSSAASAGESTYSLGLDGYYDRYHEPGGLIDSTVYGGVEGGYGYDWNKYFAAVELRAAQGRDNYKSVSGSTSGARQYEGEIRVLTGIDVITSGGMLRPYTGLGSRLFEDDGKGTITNSSPPNYGYDRRIDQFYFPIGARYEFGVGDWTMVPSLEYDLLLYGRVNTRLQNLGDGNDVNTQGFGKGFGLRGDWMVGQTVENVTYEVGPEFRYWRIQDSDPSNDPVLGPIYEPQNSRLQLGLHGRIVY